MTDFYQELCNMLIRPTRQLYHLYDLGNPIISTFGKREDFQIVTKSGKRIKCSFYRHALLNNDNIQALPTVIYLHSLNGSRLEFLPNVEPLMKMGFSVGTLDFAGCGLSDGQYVTLGANQKWDVFQLIKYIHQTYKQQKFLIWGRSMGAVTGIKFYSLFQDHKMQSRQLRDLQILGLVLDSPFWSLDQLAVQIAKNRINIPQIVLKMAFYMIQSSIEAMANFKTCELELENDVKKIHCPTMILTSKNDTLVPSEHSLTIYQNIPSQDKKLVYIQSQHNCNREKKDIQKIYYFLEEKARICIQSRLRNSFLTGIVERKFEQAKLRPVKRRHNLTLSKQKVSNNSSEKRQIFSSNNPNFFYSNVSRQNHITIQDLPDKSPQKVNKKQFSFGKIIIPQQILSEQVIQNSNRKQNLNKLRENKICYSADRPRIVFVKQLHQSYAGNCSSLQKQIRNSADFASIHLSFQHEQNLKEKNSSQTSSYKNIECLKTVKKIKRLEPQNQKDSKEVIQKQELLKSHMNVITAKLKKKSKNVMTKSFLPSYIIQTAKQNKPTCEKTLRKEPTVKSSTNLQSSNRNRTSAMQSLKNSSLIENNPYIPPYTSNREIKFPQESSKPLTPQIPTNPSMRTNEFSHRRQLSSQDIEKMYSLYQINESNQGIKTTLNNKFTFNTKNNARQKQCLSQSIGEGYEMVRPEFMHTKNMLSSQAISMRNENNMNSHKKIFSSNSKIPNEKFS